MKPKKSNRGAKPKPASKAKRDLLQIRLNAAEKQGFTAAAELDGKTLSDWIRDRLRRVAREELQAHGQNVPFLPTQNG